VQRGRCGPGLDRGERRIRRRSVFVHGDRGADRCRIGVGRSRNCGDPNEPYGDRRYVEGRFDAVPVDRRVARTGHRKRCGSRGDDLSERSVRDGLGDQGPGAGRRCSRDRKSRRIGVVLCGPRGILSRPEFPNTQPSCGSGCPSALRNPKRDTFVRLRGRPTGCARTYGGVDSARRNDAAMLARSRPGTDA
jgi:hypothetical protein